MVHKTCNFGISKIKSLYHPFFPDNSHIVRFRSFFRPKASSALFFQYNTDLGPPYHVLIDTNFVNFAIKNKIDIVQGMMDCLYAKCEYT